MNGGHAFQTIEDTNRASFHADFRGLRGALGAPSEPPPSSGRSEAATQPYTDPFAATMAAPASFASDHPDWCVDVGQELLTMTTFELWEALERGQVTAWMRVWREGMECWTPVGEISDFTWAIAGTPSPSLAPEPLAESEPPAEARTDPPQAPTAPIEAPPDSAVRPIARQEALRRVGGARWVALGFRHRGGRGRRRDLRARRSASRSSRSSRRRDAGRAPPRRPPPVSKTRSPPPPRSRTTKSAASTASPAAVGAPTAGSTAPPRGAARRRRRAS